jgi:hypothetical protein
MPYRAPTFRFSPPHHHALTPYYFYILSILSAIFILSDSFADYKEDIGYTALKQKLGPKLADGSSISRVVQVEAAAMVDHDGDDQTEKIAVWMPDPNHSEFAGKAILNRSGSPAYYSGHATGAGRYFYGNLSSIAPAIDTIESFLVGHWLGPGFLRSGNRFNPLKTAGRAANQSWVGKVEKFDSEILRRFDWVIETDEYVNAVGPCLAKKPLLGSAFNAIAVGRAAGESGAGSVAVDSLYTAGRTCPQLIAPRKNPSSASPVVASGAAVLIDLGHSSHGLSTDPVFQKTISRNRATIYNAERSEVIKAALMAGADRATRNTVVIDGDIPNIIDYRGNPGHQTTNGLDRRYGAGQFNIYHSYFIIAAGEHNSKEDAPESKGIIGNYGFDYDPYFGGVDGSNSTASYYFSVGQDFQELWSSLVWNVRIEGQNGSTFNGEGKLYNLDLFLYDVTRWHDPHLVASSTSLAENTENLWVQLPKQRRYMIQIKRGAGQTPFLWDYALAWRIGKPSDKNGSESVTKIPQ